MKAPGPTFEERRATLVARAAAERDALARELAPVDRVDRALEGLRAMKAHLPAIAVGAGVGLSALLLALPARRLPWVRSASAAISLIGSVRKLLSRRRPE